MNQINIVSRRKVKQYQTKTTNKTMSHSNDKIKNKKFIYIKIAIFWKVYKQFCTNLKKKKISLTIEIQFDSFKKKIPHLPLLFAGS